MGHFVLSPREREKSDRRDSRQDEREGWGRKWIMTESEENRRNKNIPPILLPDARIAGLAGVCVCVCVFNFKDKYSKCRKDLVCPNTLVL